VSLRQCPSVSLRRPQTYQVSCGIQASRLRRRRHLRADGSPSPTHCIGFDRAAANVRREFEAWSNMMSIWPAIVGHRWTGSAIRHELEMGAGGILEIDAIDVGPPPAPRFPPSPCRVGLEPRNYVFQIIGRKIFLPTINKLLLGSNATVRGLEEIETARRTVRHSPRGTRRGRSSTYSRWRCADCARGPRSCPTRQPHSR